MDIRELTLKDLETLVKDIGEPKFRAKQIYQWLHEKQVVSYDQMTNLSKKLRTVLQSKFPLSVTTIADVQQSVDGTRKYILRLQDGSLIETVGIPSYTSSTNSSTSDSEDAIKRLTVCFSSQVGCPFKCAFCATGNEPFIRNLTKNEIVDQVRQVQNDLKHRVSNLVAMGQGEPFLNYDNVLEALRTLNSAEDFHVGARHITVSTSGIIDGIYRFAEEPEQFTLAISLHSAVQSLRNRLMPQLSNQPLKGLKKALHSYNLYKDRRFSLEYIMIQGLNDRQEDLDSLISFTDGLFCHVNLIPFNTTPLFPGDPSSPATLKSWKKTLEEHHIETTVRKSQGEDINGACGQLKNSFLQRVKNPS